MPVANPQCISSSVGVSRRPITTAGGPSPSTAAGRRSPSRIESRPSKREMGEYIFFVDLELPHGEAPLQQALEELQPLCEHLAVFGAYPISQLEAAESA